MKQGARMPPVFLASGTAGDTPNKGVASLARDYSDSSRMVASRRSVMTEGSKLPLR